jgi:hypothetical protein
MNSWLSRIWLQGANWMNSEVVYSLLMGLGWFFLVGWAVALVATCASVFRRDAGGQFPGLSEKVRGAIKSGQGN